MAQARFHLYNEFIWPMATSILFYITLAILTFMPLFFVSVWNINSSYECVIFYKLPSCYVFENLKIIFDFVFSEDMFLINKISDIYSIIRICLIHVIFVLKNFLIFPQFLKYCCKLYSHLFREEKKKISWIKVMNICHCLDINFW